jgi:hypothetical protein
MTVRYVIAYVGTALAGLPICLFLTECLSALAFPFHGTALMFVFEALFAALGMKALERLTIGAAHRWGPAARGYLLSLVAFAGVLLWAVALSRSRV